ncbi:MAG: hypothetical protein SOT28_01615, partial [Fusicatenibacter sp.]|nr:hypothetical protein [Fusicatenibacter sp.]
MINTSSAFREAISGATRKTVEQDKIRMKDGTNLTIERYDLLSHSISDGTSGTSSFDIGGSVIGKYTATLNNMDGRFDGMDFEGAVLTAYSGVVLSDGTEELLKKGTFTVQTSEMQDISVKIEALDNMSKFDRKYDSNLSYPATIRQIVQDACSSCGVTLATKSWDN